MGISKEAFLKSNGFGNIHPGEDPDLSIRLNLLGFKTALYSDVLVFTREEFQLVVSLNKYISLDWLDQY